MRHGYRTSWDDAALVVQCLDLTGDFDPRTLRRQHGWALRRYRGEHRDKVLTVAEIRDSIDARAHTRRVAHVRSLRRRPSGKPPEMIHLGPQFVNMKFLGVPPDPEKAFASGTMTLMPDEALQMVPCLIGPAAPDTRADDADTGPIWMSPQRGHEQRMARINAEYAAVKSEFDTGVTRELVSA